MKKIVFVFISFTFMVLPVLFTMQSQSQQATIMWVCTITVTEPGGSIDTVVFGEATDAIDGPPADAYDIVKPPPPIMPPYLRVWFNDNLPEPYHLLWKDYRQYPGITKTWNLTLQWFPLDYSSPAPVTISWGPSMVNTSEYITVYLCSSDETILANMRVQNAYTFTCPALTPQRFKILCRANQPPATPSNPVPSNGATQVSVTPTLRWDCSDPDNDIVTYDVYFGTTRPPVMIVSNQSSVSLAVGLLGYQTTYYWRIIAWDNKSASTIGPLWEFTTEAGTGEPPGGTNGTSNGQNIPPIANASRSQHFGFVSENMIFDGSLSYDSDGFIVQWFWDFGDGTIGNGEITTHAYHSVGMYTVSLTVTDNNGATADDTIMVRVMTANLPPTKPVINGTRTGTKDILYAYTVSSSDPEDDFLQYRVSWGDGTSSESEFLPSGTVYSFSHSWNASGKYIIAVRVTDTISLSEETRFEVFIDVLFVRTLGFLYDASNDGQFDSFYSNTTGTITDIQHLEDGSYLLDTDGDGTWNYLFDPSTGSLTVISTGLTTIDNPWLFISIIVVAIVLIAGIVYLYKKNYF